MSTILPLPTTSSWITDNGFLAMSANSYFAKEWRIEKPELLFLPEMLMQNRVKLAEFDGKRNCLLYATGNRTFLGLDNRLLISEDLKTWKKVLELQNRENILWHIAETRDGTLFVQEYGQPLTSIYRSTDGGDSWKKTVTSKEIDRGARHFHSIAYDPYRDFLVATLGDANIVKIATSNDNGETWKPVYASAYQCLPIVVLEDRLVFGMDSAISKGILVWNLSTDSWKSFHLKHVGKTLPIGTLQSSDLKKLDNDTWIMSTGGGSLLFSNDLKNWKISILGDKKEFDAHTMSNERNAIVVVSMSDSTAIVDSRELHSSPEQEEIKQHQAIVPKIKGLGYVMKRLPYRLRMTIESTKRKGQPEDRENS